MALHKVVIVIFLACLINSCYAYQFYVGGRDGWVPNPSENYNHWAERMRFQVNDTLVFKYKKGSNSVLVVNKDDYDKCNTNNPIIKMDDGNSIFKFDHSGPFFFISGNQSYCQNGSQKLITVVLAIRPPPPSPANPPATPPAVPPATSPSVSPATPPMSHTPTLSPATSPATPPTSETPTLSPQNAPTPATSPATSPAPATGTPSTSPAPAATPPSGEIISPSPSSTPPSSSSPPGSPGNSPPGSISPASPGGGNSPPADIQAPTGSKNSAGKVFTAVSAVFVSIIFNIIIISA